MRSLWPQLSPWLDSGGPFALATVTKVSGSAPRSPGTCMAISADGLRFIGSVSSGCLDAEVIEMGASVLHSREVKQLRFGPEGQLPWREGLSCGGWVDVRVEPWWGFASSSETRALAPLVRSWLERDEPGVILSRDSLHLALDIEGKATGSSAFDDTLRSQALARLKAELPPMELQSSDGPVFVRTLRRKPKLFLVGAVDLAVALVPMARASGFSVIVVDPRRAYANAERFSTLPDRLLPTWPQSALEGITLGPRDAAVVLTHDPKIDDPALLALLATHVGYLGALGSTRSHASRLERLRPLVEQPDVLARIHGPAGLHLGSSDTASIALGILAGIVQWRAEDEALRAKLLC